jgi:transcriptional regulator with XRE-family HTH domain
MEFGVWLDAEIRRRGFSTREFAQHAGVSKTTLYDIINGKPASDKTLKQIAKALRVQPEFILRLAGSLPANPEEKPKLREALFLFDQLDDEEQDQFLKLMRAVTSQKQRDSQTALG